jgi:integral membrane protein
MPLSRILIAVHNKAATVKTSKTAFFTDREAWDYFRIAAFGEAIGWTSLITGIGISRYIEHGNNTAVDIAGQFHGTIFLIYIVAALLLSSSLGWNKKLTIIALAASVPPYGTLVFEKIMAHIRSSQAAKQLSQVTVRGLILHEQSILALQPKDTGYWCLPGGRVIEHESVESGLVRLLTKQTGVRPTIGRLCYVYQYTHRGNQRIELYFSLRNGEDYCNTSFDTYYEIEDTRFITPNDDYVLQPSFLKLQTLRATIASKSKPVIFLTGE